MKKTIIELQAETKADIAVVHHVDSALPMIMAVVHSTEPGDTCYHPDGSLLIVKGVLRIDGERPVYNMLYPVLEDALEDKPVSEEPQLQEELFNDSESDDSIVNQGSEDTTSLEEEE